MKLGKLDRRISIQRKTDTRDAHGQPIPVWAQIGRQRWAAYYPVSGGERFISEQFVSRQQTEFQVQWAQDLASLSPLDRVVFPYSATPADSDIYDIMAVHEIGRREGLRIMTARRSET
jgi:head-tail adaptor